MFPVPGTKCLLLSNDWYFGIAANTQNADLAKAFMKWAYLDPKYAIAADQAPPIKNQKLSQEFINELLSSGLPTVEFAANSDDYMTILNKSQIDFNSLIQDYLLAKNPDDVVEKYNKMWAGARKALGK